MRLFADDTSLTASAKNIDELLFEINKELPNIYDWLCANKLTLNLRKTKYLIFQPRQKVDYIEDITRWREDMNFIFEWQNNILLTRCARS